MAGDGIGLENRRVRKRLESSILSPSAKFACPHSHEWLIKWAH